jgi:ketol-acid reductoisomerase
MDIKKKPIVIFGFGAQGRAHALNLQDSGMNITICLPESSLSIADVKSSNFDLITDPQEAAKKAEIAIFLVPDQAQKDLYNEIKDSLPLNSTLIFAHGLSIHYKLIEPREDLDIVLVAPMAHGNAVRTMFLEKTGVPMLIAVGQNVTGAAWQTAKFYATALGSTEKSTIKTTFAEETETDLFTEQSLICGGLWGLIKSAFETLVEAGYSPEIAYYCCLKEAKIMSEMFANFGILGTFEKISDTARFGALSRGPRVIDKHVKEQMKEVLNEIRDGRFIDELEKELEGSEKTKEMMKSLSKHQLELMHKKINKGG